MARFSVAGRSTVAGTTVRAVASLFGTATKSARVREIHVFNTTATAVAVAVARFTNATGVGAGLTEVPMDDPVAVAIATGFAGHTADGAVSGNVRAGVLAAAVGAGIVWTFGGNGLEISPSTAAGVGIICHSGTGQILDYAIEWED